MPVSQEESDLARRLDRARELTGARQLWLSRCAGAWRGGVSALDELLAPGGEDRLALIARARRWPPAMSRAAGDEGAETPDVSAAAAVLAVARALADPAEMDEQLARSARHWRASRLHSASAQTWTRTPSSDEPVERVLRAIAQTVDLDCAGFMQLLALRLGDAEAGRAHRPVVHLPVLFDLDWQGAVGLLTLRRAAAGPPGLHPDPGTMCFVAADDAYVLALTRAWGQSTLAAEGASVVWSLSSDAEPLEEIEGGSLAGAFAVGLEELHRRSGRLGRWRPRKLDHACAISARLTPDGELGVVEGREHKLEAARDGGLRVVVGAQRPGECEDTRALGASFGVRVDCARTVEEAVARTRTQLDRTFVAAIAAMAIVLTLAGAIAALAIAHSDAHAEAARRQELAARVALESTDLDASDPRLAALLALASRAIAPGSTADQALLAVVERNVNVSQVIPAGNGQVNAVVGVTDPANGTGEQLYTTGWDGELRAWSLPSGRLLHTTRTGAVLWHLAADPVAPAIASTDEAGNVRLWDVHDPAHPTSVKLDAPPGESWVSLQFNAQGTRLYGLAENGEVGTWDVASRDELSPTNLVSFGTPLQRPTNQPLKIVAVTPAVSPHFGETHVLVATNGREILDVDLSHSRSTSLYLGNPLPGDVTALAEDEEGDDFIAIGTSNGVVLFDRTKDEQIAFPFGGFSGQVNDVAWVAGSRLAIATNEGVAITAPNTASASQTTPTGEDLPGTAVPHGARADSLTPIGGGLAAAQDDGNVTLYDPERRPLSLPSTRGSNVLAFDDRGRLLLTESVSDSNHIYDLRAINPTAGTDAGEYVTLQSYAPAESWWSVGDFYVNDAVLTREFAVAGGQDPSGQGVVLVWDAQSGHPLARLPFPGGSPNLVTEVALVPSRHLLIAHNVAGVLRVWSTRTWRSLADVRVGPSGGFSVDPSGRHALVAGLGANADNRPLTNPGGDFMLVDLRRLAIVRRVPDDSSFDVAYAPDGRSFASLGDDDKLRFFSTDNLRQLGAPMDMGGGLASGLAWRQDGRMLALNLHSGDTVVVDPRQRRLAIPPLSDPDGYRPVDAAWDPRGGILAVGSLAEGQTGIYNGNVDFWHVDEASWSRQICRLAGSDLTRAEWQRYIGSGAPYRRLCGRDG